MIRKHLAKDKAVTYYVYAPGAEGREYIGKTSTKQAAEELEAKAKLDRARVAAGVLPASALLKTTLLKAVDRFFETYQGRSKTPYEQRLRKYALKYFEPETRISAITAIDLLGYRDYLSGRFAPQTAKSTYEALAMLFAWCVDRGLLAKSPAKGLRVMKVPERAFNWIRTKAEIARLLASCSDDAVLGILAVAVIGGLRQDEIRHLRWDDVDIERRRIAVHRGRHGMTKSGRVRHVPILDSLLPILKHWRKQRLGKGLVFPGRDGVTPRSYGSGMWQIFKNAVSKAGLDETLRFHDLRHTFASHWMIDGGDIFKLSKILGHANVVMTMRYAHLAPDAFDGDYGRIRIDLRLGEARGLGELAIGP